MTAPNHGQARLNEDEQEIMTWLGQVMVRIRDWGMTVNRAEMVQAVHVLQTYAVQHMLARIEPDLWSSWTEKPSADA